MIGLALIAAGTWTSWVPDSALFEARFESVARQARAGSRRLVAAPHAKQDLRTGPLARRVADRLGADGLVVHAESSSKRARLNVNRPTEGMGLACAAEPRTPAARAIYEEYLHQVLARGPALASYVEIHGSASKASPGFVARIEIGTHGIEASEAARIRDAFVRAFPGVEILVEGIDASIRLTGGCSKKHGAMGRVPRALHLELSPELRVSSALESTAVRLASALSAI